MLIAVFGLQQTVFQNTFVQAGTLQRILLIKNTIYDPDLMRELSGDNKKIEHTVKEPSSKITVEPVLEKNKIVQNKPLDEFIATVAWHDMFGEQKETAMIIRPTPFEQKDTKKK